MNRNGDTRTRKSSVPGILGIVFGVIALKKIKANPSLEGRGMALIGLGLGIITFIWNIVYG